MKFKFVIFLLTILCLLTLNHDISYSKHNTEPYIIPIELTNRDRFLLRCVGAFEVFAFDIKNIQMESVAGFKLWVDLYQDGEKNDTIYEFFKTGLTVNQETIMSDKVDTKLVFSIIGEYNENKRDLLYFRTGFWNTVSMTKKSLPLDILMYDWNGSKEKQHIKNNVPINLGSLTRFNKTYQIHVLFWLN